MKQIGLAVVHYEFPGLIGYVLAFTRIYTQTRMDEQKIAAKCSISRFDLR